jgi:AcrR family transcriptional regulator
MGIKERREREKKEIKDLILKTVYRLVNDEGWEGVTIRKVADIIEYSPRLFTLILRAKSLCLSNCRKRLLQS